MLFAYVEGALMQARIHDDAQILRRLPETGFALLGLPAALPRPPKKAKSAKSART